MNTKIDFGIPIFQKIKDAIVLQKFQTARDIVQNTPPPAEWIVELPSKSQKGETYKTIPLDIMESAMKIIYIDAYISHISPPIINQDKSGRYAVTVGIEYFYRNFDGYGMTIPGIATVVCNDLSMLELATPKASSMAVKNAIKQLGDLFGKSLNKSEDEIEIPEESLEKQISPEEFATSLTEQIIACSTIEDLKSYRLIVYNKKTPLEIQNIYEQKLRTFKK